MVGMEKGVCMVGYWESGIGGNVLGEGYGW